MRKSNLENPILTTILFSILVKRLGGSVKITQEDINDVAYNHLEEEGLPDRSIIFTYVERKKNS